MATNFTRAALGAEGIGKGVDMIIGNGYVKGHLELALGVLAESGYLRELLMPISVLKAIPVVQ